MLAALARRGWRLALWSAAFAVGENLETARAKRYLAPGSDLVLDLTHPEARAWWKREHVAFAKRWNVSAIKLDRGEEEIPSQATDIWSDGAGRELQCHPVPSLRLREILREARRRFRDARSFRSTGSRPAATSRAGTSSASAGTDLVCQRDPALRAGFSFCPSGARTPSRFTSRESRALGSSQRLADQCGSLPSTPPGADEPASTRS
jgi:hypothetical protein